jgi:hypothetical protein
MIGQGPLRDNDPRTAALELQQRLKVGLRVPSIRQLD